jgi:hypothetical protein
MLPTLVLVALTSTAPTDFIPPFLRVTDLAFGTTAGVPTGPPFFSYLGLVPGHTLAFRVDGVPEDAGDLALLFASPAELASPWPLGSLGTGALFLDPAGAFLAAQGVLGPAASIEWTFPVPGGAPLGAPLHTQGALVDPVAGTVQMTNELDHAVADTAATVFHQATHSSHPLSFELLGGTIVVESQPAWDAEWALTGFPAPAPAVDFSQDVVVMHFAGRKPTSGHFVAIDGAQPLGPGTLLGTTLTVPHPTCGVFFVETSPECFATLDRVAFGMPFQVLETEVPSAPCP